MSFVDNVKTREETDCRFSYPGCHHRCACRHPEFRYGRDAAAILGIIKKNIREKEHHEPLIWIDIRHLLSSVAAIELPSRQVPGP